jgi:ribose 5-phosphate isomerase B
MEKKKIYIGADSAGYEYKQELIAYLTEKGYTVIDTGAENGLSGSHYPEFAMKVAKGVQDDLDGSLGILVCGTGIGMSLAANKVKGIRAAAVSEHFSAKYTRLHNNSNILCLGGRVVGIGTALELVDLFVDTEFEGGRHAKRVDKITAIEEAN